MTFQVSKTVRENSPLILNKIFINYTLFQHKQTKKMKSN